jgi:hypothetical protein
MKKYLALVIILGLAFGITMVEGANKNAQDNPPLPLISVDRA